MHEFTLTRHNVLVDPSLSVWGWEIPVYLFLGGFVAGMMIIVGYFLLRGRHRDDTCVCSVLPGLGLVLLSVGMFALFLDLEHKLYVWRLYLTFEASSPMSWGAWILLLVYPALALAWLAHPPSLVRDLWPSVHRTAEAIAGRAGAVRAIGLVLIMLGVALGIYTGILLSALGARPFWASALLGPLFLVSGLSSAAAFTHLVARHPDERELLARSDNVFLAIELAVISLFLFGLLSSSQAQLEAARLVLGGPFTAVFWVFVVGLGILIPLVIQSLAVTRRIAHTAVAPLLVMGGGLALRFVVVYAGQFSHWARF
jgi:formate-dependent nitrite reductase membrane component NrfD